MDSPVLWDVMETDLRSHLRCVFQLGDPRGLHHHTPSACCQGETVHREHRRAGTGGQRAGQGNASVRLKTKHSFKSCGKMSIAALFCCCCCSLYNCWSWKSRYAFPSHAPQTVFGVVRLFKSNSQMIFFFSQWWYQLNVPNVWKKS